MKESFLSLRRSILGSLASCFNLLCTFTIIRSFSDMNKTMGEYATFWFYMCWCVVGIFFVYFFLPETKGKSFEEIERMFANKKKQQLWASDGIGMGSSLSTLPAHIKSNDNAIFTVEPIPRVPIIIEPKNDTSFHSNDAYDDSDSDGEDNGEVVATPL